MHQSKTKAESLVECVCEMHGATGTKKKNTMGAFALSVNTALLRDENHKMVARLFAFTLQVAFVVERVPYVSMAPGSKKR